MDIRDILNKIDTLSEGIFDNEEVAAKAKQAKIDYDAWYTKRNSEQKADIEKIKSLINQYTKLKGITYTVESISKEIIESFGYDLINEYSKDEFKSDVSDFGRGVASGATLGYAPEIMAKIRSSAGDISYEDALKQELAKNDAAKKRSPWLYNTGVFAPSIATRGPLGVGMAAADIMYGKDELANPFNNTNTSTDTEQDNTDNTDNMPVTSTEPESSSTSSQQETNDEEMVSKLQTKLMNTGFDVGKHGIDGKFGSDTIQALKNYTKENNFPSQFDAMLKLIGDNEEKPVTESEKIAELRKKLSDIDEGAASSALNLGKNIVRGIANKGAIGAKKTAAEIAADLKNNNFTDLYKSASKADDIANITGKTIRGATKLGTKAAVIGSKLALNIGGKIAKYANNHKVASLLAAMAIYGYTFNPDGDIVSNSNTQVDSHPTTQPSVSQVQPTPLSTSANSVSNDTTDDESSTSPSEQNANELKQLASQIGWMFRYTSTDTSPELTTEINKLKSQWDYLSK